MPAALDAATLWLQLDPDSARARQTVIALLVNQSRLDDALPHLQKWLAAEPDRVGENFLQLSSLVASHQDKPAILRLMRTLAAPYPAVPEASLAVAQAAWNADDQATAVAATRKALELRPGWELAALFQARALQRDSADQAIVFLEGFLKSNPGARDARLNLARLLVSARRYPEARKQFEILVGEAPNNPEIAMAVATLSLQAKDYTAAELQLRRALEINPKEPDVVRLYLGQVNEELKRDDQALQWYSSVAPGSPAATAGASAEAAQACEKAFAAGLDAPETWFVYGRALAGQSRLDEALAALDQALRRRPAYGEALTQKAKLIWAVSNDADQAAAVFPDHPAFTLSRAEIYRDAGDAPRALALVDQAAWWWRATFWRRRYRRSTLSCRAPSRRAASA